MTEKNQYCDCFINAHQMYSLLLHKYINNIKAFIYLRSSNALMR